MRAAAILLQLQMVMLIAASSVAAANQTDAVQESVERLIRLASKDIASEIAGEREPIQESDTLARLIFVVELQWPDVLGKISEVAPDDLSKATLFRAAEELPVGMYLEALESALALTEAGEFESSACLDLLYPTGSGLGFRFYFLADNYRHPRVKGILSRFRRLLAVTSNLRLPQNSGRTKSDVLKRIAAIESGAEYRSHEKSLKVSSNAEKGPPIAVLSEDGSGLASRRIPPNADLDAALSIAQAEYKEKWFRAQMTRDVFDAPVWRDLAEVLKASLPRDAGAFLKVAPSDVRRWLVMQAAAFLPVKDHLAMMEILVAAMKPGSLKKDVVLKLLHAEGNGRRTLLEDNRDHSRIRSLHEQIAKVEVDKLGLQPEFTNGLLQDSLPNASPVSGIPPERRLNPIGDNFLAKEFH